MATDKKGFPVSSHC